MANILYLDYILYINSFSYSQFLISIYLPTFNALYIIATKKKICLVIGSNKELLNIDLIK